MLDFPRWKVIGISVILALGVIFSIPSFLPQKQFESLPSFAQMKVNLGLDLAGGSHLLLEADLGDLQKTQLANMEKTVRTAMRGERGPDDDIAIGELSTAGGKISFLVRDQAQLDEARERLFRETQGAGLTGQRDWTIDVVDTTRIVMTPTKAGQAQAISRAMDTARDIIDKRVNALGTREPTIIRQGDDRIVVQVPGLQDPQQLKDLIGKTARLEFRMVDTNADPNEVAAGRVPVGSEVVPYSPDAGNGVPFEVLRRQVMISGDQLIDAKQSYDPQSGLPVVTIRFDSGGSATFAKVTAQNVGKRFAMVLDGRVLSAPSINEPILGGSAQISGNFTVASANALAISLRSGALPVKMAVVEERTVTPELGADSIRKGAIAGIIATVAVLAFMIVVYGRFGIYANVALFFNIFLIVAIMAAFNATLTLPGIAGHDRRRGRRQRADQRTYPRRVETRATRLSGGRAGLQGSQPRDFRRQYHQRHCRRADVLVRHRADQGLRGRADHRHRDQRLHRGYRDPHVRRALAAQDASGVAEYLIEGPNPCVC